MTSPWQPSPRSVCRQCSGYNTDQGRSIAQHPEDKMLQKQLHFLPSKLWALKSQLWTQQHFPLEALLTRFTLMTTAAALLQVVCRLKAIKPGTRLSEVHGWGPKSTKVLRHRGGHHNPHYVMAMLLPASSPHVEGFPCTEGTQHKTAPLQRATRRGWLTERPYSSSHSGSAQEPVLRPLRWGPQWLSLEDQNVAPMVTLSEPNLVHT